MTSFDRDPDFIGREEVFEEIEKKLIVGQHRIALTEVLGGCLFNYIPHLEPD